MLDSHAIKELIHPASSYLSTLAMSVGGARLALKLVSSRLLRRLTGVVAYVREHGDSEVNARVERVLASAVYRAAAFALDYLASVKLPAGNPKTEDGTPKEARRPKTE